MDWLFGQLGKEWAVIRQTPLASILCVVLGLALGGLGIGFVDNHQLAAMATDRDLYRDRLQERPAPPPVAPPHSTISAPNPSVSGNSDRLDKPPAQVVGIPADFIFDAFKGRTDAEAQRIIEPYFDRPVTVTGVVRNVMTRENGEIMVVTLGRCTSSEVLRQVGFGFSGELASSGVDI